MKIRLLMLIALSLVLFACSTENQSETSSEEATFTINSSTENLRNGTGIDWPCIQKPCDPNYIIPRPSPGQEYQSRIIYYDPNEVAVGDIPCIREQYFECFSELGLVLPIIQSQDPYQEMWQFDPGKPGTGLDTTLCNDPRTNTTCDD